MRFSNRSSFGSSLPNALSFLLEKKKAAGADILDLTESNPTRCGFAPAPLEALSEARNRFYEPDPRGGLPAREAVCGYYASRGVAVHPEDVFLTCGTSEAYSFLFHLFCDPGDRVLCASPAYPLIDHLAAYAGVDLERFSGFDGLGERAGASLLTLVNPSNPTGRYVSEGDWRLLDGFCGTNGTAVISDEVFFDFNWTGRARTSAASRSGGLRFTLNGVSKMLGLPQMKLAWILLSGPKDERRAAAARLETMADAFLSVNTPSQNALASWLKEKDTFVAGVLERLKTNFTVLQKLFPGLEEPEGGWYATVPLSGGLSDEETALRLLEENDVVVHPGYLFDLENDCLVVSLLPEAGRFLEGARRLARTAGVLC